MHFPRINTDKMPQIFTDENKSDAKRFGGQAWELHFTLGSALPYESLNVRFPSAYGSATTKIAATGYQQCPPGRIRKITM
jgi:hypothetical protein